MSGLKKISRRRMIKDRAINVLMYLAAGIIILLLAFLIGYILFRGLPHITWSFLSQKPSLVRDTVGILPNILNTIYIVIMTLIVVLPLGVGSAVYLNEYAKNRKLVRVIELATETLAGIPSIIYGLVGMLIFVHFSTILPSRPFGISTDGCLPIKSSLNITPKA